MKYCKAPEQHASFTISALSNEMEVLLAPSFSFSSRCVEIIELRETH